MTRMSIQQARDLGIISGPKPKKKISKPNKAFWSIKLVDVNHADGSVTEEGIKISIPDNMPSLNEWKLWHWAKQDRFKKDLTEDIKMLALSLRKPALKKAVIQIIHYHKAKRRRDDDNYTPKFLLDALRYAGLIEDDNAEVLELRPPVFKVDKEAWRTEVYIWEK